MKKIGYLFFIGMIALALLTGCENKQSQEAAAPEGHPDMQAAETTPQLNGKVLQVLNAGSFTYIEVQADAGNVWVAAPAFQVQVDEVVMVPGGKLMDDFYSKSLDRTFQKVYFVSNVLTENAMSGDAPQMPPTSKTPSMSNMPGMSMGMGGAAGVQTPIDCSGVEKIEGGQTIGQLYADKQNFVGKSIKLRAKVLKFRPNIMGTNWLHVQDASGSEKDLTVTSQDFAEVGDTVVVSGLLVADKDFGHGRVIELAVEAGKIAVEKN